MLGWAPGPFWTFGEEKNLLRLLAFELRTHSGCTDRAIAAPLPLMQRKISRVWCKLQHVQQICFSGLFMVRIKIYLLIIVDYIERSVAQLVEALRYKPEGRGFDSRWCHWNFLLTYSFRPYCGPGVDSAYNRNEYQEYFLGGKGGRCLGLTTLPPSCADCYEIWESQPPGTLRVCPGP